MDDSLLDLIHSISIWVVPILIAFAFHEAAHSYVGWRLGDDTAYRLGRVTLNPFKHIDQVGTIILPGLLVLTHAPFVFGWAKPAPANWSKLRVLPRDIAIVAAAGPASNLLLAFMSALLVHSIFLMPEFARGWYAATLQNLILLNLLIVVLNMLPIPPLDGGRVAIGLLPIAWGRKLVEFERYGWLIVILLLVVLPMIGWSIGIDLSFAAAAVTQAVAYLANLILMLAGVI